MINLSGSKYPYLEQMSMVHWTMDICSRYGYFPWTMDICSRYGYFPWTMDICSRYGYFPWTMDICSRYGYFPWTMDICSRYGYFPWTMDICSRYGYFEPLRLIIAPGYETMFEPLRFDCNLYASNKNKYSKTSMARTSLGPWKFIRYLGSSSHWGLIMVSGQEANGDNFKEVFLIHTIIVCWVSMRRF